MSAINPEIRFFPTHTKDVDRKLDRQAFASLVRLHEFRVQNRLVIVSKISIMHAVQVLAHNSRSVYSISNASDDSSNDHLRDAISRRLQHCSNRQDETSQPDTVLSTEFFASEQAEQ